ncbi:SusD/RagB family nutrient-binding outer membrane lipoprotein [Pedobacter arcticus]|uniref:SusD/RagB family nutrient-binding outer membrane lipoprotein n=1 Tax=Pedobacter arcticus TaxID=752140 RepID=UPI0002F75FD2|nr:SusD/RagB family nutrient-binding outer membrane lipoprotein [Pedobacter arcticus]
MKKKQIFLLWLVIIVSACTKKYEDYNTNPYLSTLEQQEADNYASGKNFPAMINAVLPAGDALGRTDFVNSYQIGYNLAGDSFSGFMGQAGDWGGNSNNLTYAFNLSWVNEQFTLTGKLMAGWKNVRDLTTLSGDSLQFSVAQIIKVAGVIKATDSYGPIPSSSLASGSFTPSYESQESIYYAALADLIRARDILFKFGGGAGSPLKSYDLIYAGDYLKWARFANSLILRLSIRMAYVAPDKAKQYAEEAIANQAGMIAIGSDNATQGIKPGNGAFNYANPLRTLTQDYKEARMSASMQSILTGYNDPRIAVWFKPATLVGHTSEYLGIRSGINVTRASYQPFSELNVTDQTPMPWMQASEVCFLKAEGALRGWNAGGTAQQWYETGITTAFSETGAAMPVGYLTDNLSKPKDYTDFAAGGSSNSRNAASTITIKWDDAALFEVKLERIITQKWLALYPNGQEAWSEFRRTGFPKIFPISLNKGNIDIVKQVRRLPYPLAQYQQNGEQVAKGIALLGGADNGGTRLWWDKKP